MSDLFGNYLPQEVRRSDGTLYRARKTPKAIPVHLCGFTDGVLVLRCHDREIAVGVALDEGLLDLHDLDRLDRGPLWVRYVVEYDAYERELRGTTGATPAYLFATTDPTPGKADIVPTDTNEGSDR